MPRKRKEHPDRWNEPFPQRLRKLLDEQNLSHQAFGDYLGVARQSVGNYCDGSVSPSTDTLIKVADYFSVSVDYLLGRTDVRAPEPNVQMASSLTGLSEAAIQTLHSYRGEAEMDGALSTLDSLLTYPDFDAVAVLWARAWHCAQGARRWNDAGSAETEEAAELDKAMKLIERHGMAVRSLEESAQDHMARACDYLKLILTSLAADWCEPEESDIPAGRWATYGK